ncbi:MAG: PD40 domain-containing protein, partial [Calditrichia bacterium]|nr:PD40 domain-containing protein [Calditrichia bacterium]
WSKDDEWLIYQSEESGVFKLNKIRSNGTEKQLLIPGSSLEQKYPDVSPDGQKVLFYGRYGGGWDLFYVNIDGTGLTQLTNDSSVNHYHSSWSPDGEKIVYLQIDGSSADGLYIMDKYGNNSEKIFSSYSSNIYPDWK